MPAIHILDMGGELPSRSPRLLPNNNSETCHNVWLSEGALDTFSLPAVIQTLEPTTRYIYRIPETVDIGDYGNSTYMQFEDPDAKVVKGPTANDSFERFYWTEGGNQPAYNTKARIINGDVAFSLGIPTPTGNIVVTPDGSGSGLTEYRAYVYTWVSAYGEEGPPSPPVLANGKIDDVWNLTLPAVTGFETAQRNLTERRVYRTITGSAGDTNFYLVTTLPIATLSFADNILGAVVTANGIIPSTLWVAPPTTLTGLITMPNGIIAGYTERDVYFCEPYRPHAWPAAYSLSVEQPIVGLGVIGSTLIVLTTGYPYSISGIHPSQMAQSKNNELLPCSNSGSIVSAPNGVYYASKLGLMVAANGSFVLLTNELISKRMWSEQYRPEILRAVYYNGTYMGMQSEGSLPGFSLHMDNPKISINKIVAPRTVNNILVDAWTGDVCMIMNRFLYQWDSEETDARIVYDWKSKEFHLPKPDNIAALKVYFDDIPSNSQSLSSDAWATASLALLAEDKKGTVKLYADRQLVYTRDLPVTAGTLMRLPSGFKAEVWQIEIIGRVRVDSIQIASSVKELAAI